MSTSDGPVSTCGVCGDVLDPTRIDSGCVFCNPDKERLARQPEVPVNPGPGCLQHGTLGCSRCGQLEASHRLAIEEWHPDRDRGARGLGVALLFVLLMLLTVLCFWYAFSSWPN